MTRHSKNCTASAVYSYHEKNKDANSSGYGSLKLRYGKDGVKDFDCCCLSLHPCRDPVVTQEGFLYDREAILEYIVTKKNEINRKIKAYEKQCKKEMSELEELGHAEVQSKVQKFLKSDRSVGASAEEAGTSSSTNNLKNKKLPSFWVPALTPENKEAKIEKPGKTVYCPMSGKPLKVKDLVNVKFTLADKTNDSSLEGKKDRYKCPVTGDILGNNVPCAVLRTTGDVVTMECIELIQNSEMIHPITSEKLKEKDIIPLQRGGTGFASVNEKLAGVKHRPVMAF